MELNRLKTDATKETDGVWMDLGDGASALIARINNPRCAKLFSQLTDRRKRSDRFLSDKAQEDIMVKVIAETVFLDFKNITEDGKALTNTLESRTSMLRVRDFRDWITDLASDMDNFVMEGHEDDKKKSKSSSVSSPE